MHGAVASVGDEREVARVGAVGREDLAHGVGHVGVDDALDAPRRLDHVELQGVGHVALDRFPGGVDVQRHAPAREVLDRQVAEHGVGVGDRGMDAAASVAGGAGLRPGAVGPDEQGALTHVGDAAATGADALHVDHRQADVVAVAPVPVGLDLRLAAAHEAHVIGRAAHVDGDEVVDAAALGRE